MAIWPVTCAPLRCALRGAEKDQLLFCLCSIYSLWMRSLLIKYHLCRGRTTQLLLFQAFIKLLWGSCFTLRSLGGFKTREIRVTCLEWCRLVRASLVVCCNDRNPVKVWRQHPFPILFITPHGIAYKNWQSPRNLLPSWISGIIFGDTFDFSRCKRESRSHILAWWWRFFTIFNGTSNIKNGN